MSKIYEALEYARKKQPELAKKAVLSAVRKTTAPRGPEPDLEEEMVRLFQVLDPCVADPKKRILQFIGSKEGEGASTTARQFAAVAARRFGKSVLLLDADQKNASQCHFYKINTTGWSDALMNGEPIEKAIQQVGESTLYVSGISENSYSIAKLFSSPRIDACFEDLKQKFDIIVIDSPASHISSDGLAVSNKVDGVILVIEAENTRAPIAEKTKEDIIQSGGKLLGILFNKRKFYIPPFIYERLS